MELTSFENLKDFFGTTEFKNRGMSKTQMDNFIFAMQITSHRVAYQMLSELYVRYNSQDGNNLEMKEIKAEKMILEEKLEEAKTPGEIELAKVKIEKKEHDIRMLMTKMRQTQKEIDHIMTSLNDYEKIVGQKITDIDLEDEVAEREYWVKRLSKQAGLDMITSGRISSGNMESLMALPDHERNQVLKNTMAITHAIQYEMTNAEQQLLEKSNPEMLLVNKNDILGNKLPSTETGEN